MKLGTLSKIKGGSALRTNEVDGNFEFLPEVGEPFAILGKALDPTQGNMRLVSTSRIVEILKNDSDMIQFKTETGSVYELKIRDVQ